MTTPASITVSVIIPCYNQAQFLGAAIASVLEQKATLFELIIVNDGSQDATRAVAGAYLNASRAVRYCEQANAGLAAARNKGLSLSRGRFVVFLDADDRLLPGALKLGASLLAAHPTCAFVAGAHRDMNADGQLFGRAKGPSPKDQAYAAMLQQNDVGMIAAAMFRREALLAVGAFDTSLAACEDYDLYLKLTRIRPVHYHRAAVAAYRRHAEGMSRDAGLILRYALAVQARQQPFVAQADGLQSAFRTGRRALRGYYGKALTGQLRYRWQRQQFGFLLKGLADLGRYAPLVGARELLRFVGDLARRSR